MKKLTLTEACLMDASGELGDKARTKLQEHVQKYPAALLEHEIARGNMDLLRSLPKHTPSQDEAKMIAANIKTGIQKKLWARKHEAQSKRRWKIIYQSLATISAAAAGLLIALSVVYLQNQDARQRAAVAREDARQRAAIARAEQVLDSYLSPDDPTAMEQRLGEVSDSIEALSNEATATVVTGSPIVGFVNEWDPAPDDEMEMGPPTDL